jgi:hypothetical protein
MQYFKISFMQMIAAVTLTCQQAFGQSKKDRNRPGDKAAFRSGDGRQYIS